MSFPVSSTLEGCETQIQRTTTSLAPVSKTPPLLSVCDFKGENDDPQTTDGVTEKRIKGSGPGQVAQVEHEGDRRGRPGRFVPL